MEGRHEGLEPLDRAYDLSPLSGEVEAVGRGDRSVQQCRQEGFEVTVFEPAKPTRGAGGARALPGEAELRTRAGGWRDEAGDLPRRAHGGGQSGHSEEDPGTGYPTW